MGKLFYRLPGQEVVILEGEFIELELDKREAFKGFVTTTADGERWFGFSEGKVVDAFYQMQKPFIVTKEMYLNQAQYFIENIKSWEVGKAVLSRVKEVNNGPIHITSLFHALQKQYPNAFTYAFQSNLLGSWIAATPEVLVKQQGDNVSTMSLAGTRKVGDEVPWHEKEFQEQGLVTAYVAAVLKEVGAVSTVSPREELIAGPVKHLINRFDCKVDRTNVFELIDLLHPTPAVSGLPIDKAQELIARVEPHQRLLYSGIVGVLSKEELSLYVNLRCGQIIDENLYLYLGGGLTKDSSPEDEWMETENKAQTLLNVFQNI